MMCINEDLPCIGRDYKELKSGKLVKACCVNEIKDEAELAQSIMDIIDDCSLDFKNVKRLSSKLIYAAYTINVKKDENLKEMLSVISRFAILVYEQKQQIREDADIITLVMSFTKELGKWFSHKFIDQIGFSGLEMIQKSMTADVNTIEMSLGLCMIDNYDTFNDDLDDLFF